MDMSDTDTGVQIRQQQFEELEGLSQEASVSPLRAGLRRFMRDKRAVISLGVILFIIIFSFVFPPIYQHLGPTIMGGPSGTTPVGPQAYHTPTHQELTQADVPGTFFPLGKNSLVYPLGTDGVGRDILARLMAGVNVSIELALMVEIFDIGLGVVLGTLAGWYGGWLGMVLDRFTDIMFAFPSLLLVILMGASLGPIFDKAFGKLGMLSRMLMLTLAIGIIAWPLMMRFVRGQTVQLKEQQFVEAARTTGTSDAKIIMRHIIPNLMNIVVVASTLSILNTIISEAGISLLGVGIQAPNSSLGLMILNALNALYTSWTELLWPCLTLVILIVAFSFVGDGVRDAFDPRTKD